MERRNNAQVMVESVALNGKRVIDVGCGDGSLARMMTKNGAHVLGVECSLRQLAKARAAQKAGDEEIVEGVGQALPAPDGAADVVVFFNSLHHIPAEFMGTALEEAARVLRPGGQVYVSEPVAEGLFFQTCRPVDDESQVRAQAQAAIKACRALSLEREIIYLHTLKMASYEAFRERIISANDEREARFAALDEEMRALFEKNAMRSDDGWVFDQPMRVALLRKV